MVAASARRPTWPCIWMSAGLLSYKLCDRDLNCEHCPLDAALRGRTPKPPQNTSLLRISDTTDSFPNDRLFSPGHTWVRGQKGNDERQLRFGLDAFAATIIGHCCEIICAKIGLKRLLGEVLCEIDVGLGMLLVAAPVGATVVAENGSLKNDPNLLVTAPFDDGWVADLRVHDLSQLRNLLNGREAREQTRMDLRRFRRRVALQLLADSEGIGPCLPDGGELADLRQTLAGAAYLNLIRELIH